MTVLLVDAGNTRVKWALWDGVRGTALYGHGSLRHGGEEVPDLAPLLALAEPPAAVMLASVATAGLDERLAQALSQVCGCSVRTARVQRELRGLTAGYARLESLGVDRWLALLGAGALVGYPCVVADLGTAVTVDAVDADGRHLGGAIAPGRWLQRTSLWRSTARIPASADGLPAPATLFAGDTAGGVAAGVDHGIAALVTRAWQRAAGNGANPAQPANPARIPSPPLLVTGGDAPALRPLLPASARVEPDLVLLGLRIVFEATVA